MSQTLNAFVLAAGIGERLRPVTEHIPKPLLPVVGRSLLARTLERVALLSVDRIGVNAHYKSDVIEQWVAASPYREKVTLFPETVLLGTGGALKNAERLLGQGTFVVHNSDIVTDIELGALLDIHHGSGSVATLALHDYPAFNKVGVSEDGAVIGVGEAMAGRKAKRILAFTGIASMASASACRAA